ncbi:MAG TPA: hypothetical protein VHE83_18455 [Mycobacteriales bacterium]|nr:hypothetical protein [Mycobacteriales bacterium]
MVAAAVVPASPMLVPDVSTGAAGEVAALRVAADDAVRRLVELGAEALVVLASGPRATYPHGSAGTFAGLGVPLRVHLGDDVGEPPSLPLELCIGAWFLERAGGSTATVTAGVTVDGSWASPDVDVALLVVADGSACRTEKAPGAFDPRAAGFDAQIATALRGGDGAALLGLDAELAADLRVAGLPALRALGALPGPWQAQLLADEAGHGVGSFVAYWERG